MSIPFSKMPSSVKTSSIILPRLAKLAAPGCLLVELPDLRFFLELSILEIHPLSSWVISAGEISKVWLHQIYKDKRSYKIISYMIQAGQENQSYLTDSFIAIFIDQALTAIPNYGSTIKTTQIETPFNT